MGYAQAFIVRYNPNMNDDLLLSYYKNPDHFGELSGDILSAEASNMSCGDEIAISVDFSNGEIKNMQYKGAGCSVCLACAEIAAEFAQLHHRFMTQKELLEKIGMEENHKRIKCASLVIEAQQKIPEIS